MSRVAGVFITQVQMAARGKTSQGENQLFDILAFLCFQSQAMIQTCPKGVDTNHGETNMNGSQQMQTAGIQLHVSLNEFGTGTHNR